MVKRKSHLASTEGFRVRVLIGVHIKEENGRATREETGTGWKPVERRALRVRLPPLPLKLVSLKQAPMVKRKSRFGPNEAFRVRVPVGEYTVFVV